MTFKEVAEMNKILFIGTGYVGLVLGTCFADKGYTVTCSDIDEDKIKLLNAGISPLYEPKLNELIKKNLNHTLFFSSNVSSAIKDADVIFLTVGTPISETEEPDLSFVEAAAQMVADNLNSYKIIIVKSTVPVGTANHITQIIKSKNPFSEFDVISNPEFLREGSAIQDCLNMDRIVIGSANKIASHQVEKLYQFFDSKAVLHTNHETAEMIKYASNAFLATKISFINCIANICEHVGADVELISKGMGLDDRIGEKFLKAGIGYGGSCLPKDTKTLVQISEKHGYDFKLLKSVIETNEIQPYSIIQKLLSTTKDKNINTVGVFGLAFKPDTSDMRYAPSIKIIQELIELGFEVKAFDPVCTKEAKEKFIDKPNISFSNDLYEVANGLDVCLILTEWQEIKDMDLNKLLLLLNHPIIIDGRNIFNVREMKSLGFSYYSIGRAVCQSGKVQR